MLGGRWSGRARERGPRASRASRRCYWGSKGIGRAIAEGLASEGVYLALCAQDAAVLESAANGLRRLVAPSGTRLEVARAYAISKLGWIRDQRARLGAQARETPRRYVERESHYLWGRRYLLSVVEKDEKPSVKLDHRRMMLTVRPGSTLAKREELIQELHRAALHKVVPALIRKWEVKLRVEVSGYFLQRMKTKWGGCNHRAGNIRLNTELAKKPRDLLEYVIVHEMAHQAG